MTVGEEDSNILSWCVPRSILVHSIDQAQEMFPNIFRPLPLKSKAVLRNRIIMGKCGQPQRES